jgi:hypothetical protein
MWDVRCEMWDVRCEMLDVGFGMGHAARECSPTDHADFHRCRAGCFIKKHETRRSPTDQRKVIAPMRTDVFFTDCLLLLRCLLLGFRCAAGAKDRHGFFAGGKYDEVVCHMTGLDMRSDGHVPKGQKFIAQRQAKRRPGYNVPWSLRHVREKVLKQSVLCLLLPLQGVM